MPKTIVQPSEESIFEQLGWSTPQLKFLSELLTELYHTRELNRQLTLSIQNLTELLHKRTFSKIPTVSSFISTCLKPNLAITTQNEPENSQEQSQPIPPVTPVITRKKMRRLEEQLQKKNQIEEPHSINENIYPPVFTNTPAMEHSERKRKIDKKKEQRSSSVPNKQEKRKRNGQNCFEEESDSSMPEQLAFTLQNLPPIRKKKRITIDSGKDQIDRESDNDRLVPLSEKIVCLLEFRYGLQVPKSSSPRKYGYLYQHNIPSSIQMFNDITWDKNMLFSCYKGCSIPKRNMSFSMVKFQEILLDEWNQIEYLRNHQDACVIAIGNEALITHLDPKNHRNIADFDVYIYRPYVEVGISVDGPFHISEIVEHMEGDYYVSEEEEGD
jgi:hypothetical protein